MAKKRRILFFSGSRADYGRLSPIWRAVENHNDLEMTLCVSGTHLCNEFGYSRALFDKDGFKVDYEIPILLSGGIDGLMGKSIGLGLIVMNDILLKERPDFVFVFGDRSEMLIPAIVAVHMNIPVIHMAGGFVTSGSIDEMIRHSLTKMAHVHLATSKKCLERIKKMGEESNRIYFVGSPAIDYIKAVKYKSKKSLYTQFNLDPSQLLIIVTYHPVTTEHDNMRSQIDALFSALKNIKAQILITYPNSDLGGDMIVERIKKTKHYHIEPDLSMDIYLNFLKHADLMVGNSSSGFIEAPYYGLPVINVGNRQLGRDREINICDVSTKKEDIAEAISVHLTQGRKLKEQNKKNFGNTYGNGNAAQKTVKIISGLEITTMLLQKKMTY